MSRRALLFASLIALGAAFLARPLGTRPVLLELGAFDAPYRSGVWGRADRADVDPQATTDGVTSFYFRPSPANGAFLFPVVASGDVKLALRATARVRSGLSIFVNGERAGEVLVRPGPWDVYTLTIPRAAFRGAVLDLGMALRPLPLVKGAHADDPHILVDSVSVESPEGLALSPRALALVAIVPLASFGFAWLLGMPAVALAAAGIAAGAVALLIHAAPLATLAAIPRLLPLALFAGLLANRALRRWTSRFEASLLALLVVLATLGHGSLVFFPNHNPPDIEIHTRRTLDLGNVPLEYQALLRYGSQLPTASQDQGAATAALGEKTLIPYSPLPYVFYYLLHLLGFDLDWAMTAWNAALAALVAPCLFLTARRIWNAEAGWIACLLYLLDLAVWHHLGRSHAPAVFGAALGTLGLLLIAGAADTLETRRAIVLAGCALGFAALGYSSLVVLYGLFGSCLLALLLADARGLSSNARRGLATALVTGGLVAGVLFYFHYAPGLLGGARSVEAEPDLFPGKTFLIFHNESRQSLRLWVLGFWIPLLAGLLAAPLVLVRARPWARPVLVAWLLAWALIMLLKEPGLFPKLLRWAKEDQFVSPLLCLFLGAVCAALPKPWQRRLVAALVLAEALALQVRDFGHHANSLRL